MNPCRFFSLLLSLLLASTSMAAPSTLSASETRSLFDQANAEFRQANQETNASEQRQGYERAILLYERLIGEGAIRNAKLFYNLGNAHVLNGNVGHAILNYRRAQQLDRSDPDISKNLAFARSRCTDRIGINTEQRVRQTLFFWHYDFAPATRAVLSCMGFGGICLAITLMLWRGRGSHYTLAAVLSVILLVANAASLLVEAGTQANTHYGVITANDVVARQGDGSNYAESFKAPLHAGTEFTLLEARSGWFRILLANNSECWIPDTAARKI